MTPVRRPSQVHPTYVRLLRMLLSSRALDADAVLAEAGLSWAQVSVDDQALDYERVERALAAALKAAGRPWIGLELGAAMQLASHGAIGRAAMASRDLRQAMQAVARFGRLRVDLFRWEFLPTPGGAVLRISEDHPLGSVRQVVLEALFAALLKLVEAVVGPCPQGVQADLPFAAPPWQDRLAACGAGTLRFERPVLAFQFSDAVLDLPGLGADPVAFQAAWRECEQALALAQAQAPSLSAQVAALLGGVGEQAHFPRPGRTGRAAACLAPHPDAPAQGRGLQLSAVARPGAPATCPLDAARDPPASRRNCSPARICRYL